jgi:hypothetical protein
MIARLATYAYPILWVGIGIAGVCMDCDPDFYAPPKLYWSRAAWWAFVVLWIGSVFIRPKRSPKAP